MFAGKDTYMAVGMAIGVGVGTAIGAAFGNIAIGIAIGISLGAAVATIWIEKTSCMNKILAVNYPAISPPNPQFWGNRGSKSPRIGGFRGRSRIRAGGLKK